MHARTPLARFALAVALVLALPPVLPVRPAHADTWSHDPAVNLPVAVSAGPQYLNGLADDGAGGLIVVWTDRVGDPFANPPALLGPHSSHVRPNGEVDAAWSTALVPGTQTNFGFFTLPDSTGGAWMVWSDIRNSSTTGRDLYVHHLRPGGTPDPAFPVGGRVLCNAAGGQYLSNVLADGHGGMLVFWADRRDSAAIGRTAIYAGHVLASGAVDPAWPVNGLNVCEAAGSRGGEVSVPDGAGGALLAWYDNRNVVTTGSDLYATHLLANGTLDPAWPANGRAVITQPGQQISPQATGDGAGGLYLTWYDVAKPPAVQHVLRTGVVDPAWPAAGIVLDAGVTQWEDAQISGDGSTGAILAWDATTGNVTHSDLYAAHVLANGTFDPAWPAEPARLAPSASNKWLLGFSAAIVPPGGGVMLQWQDDRAGGFGLYVDRLLPTGVLDPAWPALGRLLTPNGASAGGAGVIPDGRGGLLYAWSDTRDSLATDWNVYADRIGFDGLRGVDQPGWCAVRDVPGDQGGRVSLQWYWSSWDNMPADPLSQYNVWRQLPASAVTAAVTRRALPASSQVVPRTGDIRVRGTDATGTFWEYLASVPPRGTPEYALTVSTLADSGADGAAREVFEVDAVAVGTAYASLPDSGCSVDNLAPPAPTGFAGTYAGGATTLVWNPVLVTDLASYLLYRGVTAGFTPSPTSLVAAPTTTHFTDVAGQPSFYKLTAVDVHGNEGPVATLLPAGTLGVPHDAPAAVALALSSASPARGAAAFAIALPRAARARLAVYDAAGRHVRTLLDGAAPAGRRAVAWNLADDAGRDARDGLYFAVLEADGVRRTLRLVVLR